MQMSKVGSATLPENQLYDDRPITLAYLCQIQNEAEYFPRSCGRGQTIQKRRSQSHCRPEARWWISCKQQQE